MVTTALSRLIAGHRRLAVTFWGWAIAGGILVNGAFTAASLLVTATGWPAWLAVAVHLLAVPWNLLVLIAVWNSADRYTGPLLHGLAARCAVIPWTMLLCIL